MASGVSISPSSTAEGRDDAALSVDHLRAGRERQPDGGLVEDGGDLALVDQDQAVRDLAGRTGGEDAGVGDGHALRERRAGEGGGQRRQANDKLTHQRPAPWPSSKSDLG